MAAVWHAPCEASPERNRSGPRGTETRAKVRPPPQPILPRISQTPHAGTPTTWSESPDGSARQRSLNPDLIKGRRRVQQNERLERDAVSACKMTKQGRRRPESLRPTEQQTNSHRTSATQRGVGCILAFQLPPISFAFWRGEIIGRFGAGSGVRSRYSGISSHRFEIRMPRATKAAIPRRAVRRKGRDSRLQNTTGSVRR